MSVSSFSSKNPARLFSLLTDSSWAHLSAPIAFSEADYEYLLRFCEVNRNHLNNRIDKEVLSIPTSVLIHRICLLLLDKWDGERDYRFLNLLYKFRAKGYLDNFLIDAAGRDFRIQLDQTLNRELHCE